MTTVKTAEGFGSWVRGFSPRKKPVEAAPQEENIYAASLASGDAPPTGASDYLGPSALALANENLNSPEALAYLAELEKSQKEAIEAQRGGIASAQRNLEAYNSLPVQYDLSPLMNLSDSWFGSNLSKGYKAPTSPTEMIAARSALEGALNKARSGLTDAEKERLQQNLVNRQKTAQLLNDAAIADLKRKELGMEAKGRQDYKKEQQANQQFHEFDKEYGTKIRGLSELRSSASNLKNILRSNGNKIPEYGTTEYAEYKSEVAKVIVAYNKYKAELGALAGGDLNLLNATISEDENYAKAALKQMAFSKDMGKIIENMNKDVDTGVNTLKRQTARYEKYFPNEYKNTFDSYEVSKKGRQQDTGEVSKEDAEAILKGIQ